MSQDWSNEWLQRVAGWKAVKAGLSLMERGLVKTAEFSENECRGSVGSSKVLRVRVKRSDTHQVETFCPCPENQRTGAMCEHAVSIIAAARQGVKAPVIETAAPQTNVRKTTSCDVAYEVELFPRWLEEWKNGRLTVKISQASGPSEPSDAKLHDWLQKNRLDQQPSPWILPLSSTLLREFLELMFDRGKVATKEQTIVLNNEFNPWKVCCERIGDKVKVQLQEDAGVFLGARAGEFFTSGSQINRIKEPACADFIFTLFTEKHTKITVNELIANDRLLSILQPADEGDWLSTLRWESIDPEWFGELDGGLDRLFLRVEAKIPNDATNTKRSFQDLHRYRNFEGDTIYSVDQQACLELTRRLREQGWKQNGDLWLMDEEEALLPFFQGGLSRLKAMFSNLLESERLGRMLGNLVVLRSHLDVQEHSSREMSLQFEFEDQEGKKFDPEKIRQLLRSGKRLIQTNDGKSLLLPKESWESFLHAAQELQFAQHKGRFLAKNAHLHVIHHLREYYNKSLDSNNLIESDGAYSGANFPKVDADLRPYQGQGVMWLQERLNDTGFALLADEMGLGKTIQTIVLISHYAAIGHPALVVVPTSLLQNWVLEIAKFAPSLKTIVLHGDKRDDLYPMCEQCHVIVTSYGILVNDRARLMKQGYSMMVLDEASMIRNPDTDAARAAFRIQADKKLALTGTPIENSMLDLWSIFQFLQPGYLGEREHFRNLYEKPGAASASARESLRLRVTPFVLRRTKDLVAKDLPEKMEIDSWCELSPQQREIYQKVLDEGLTQIDQLYAKDDRSAHMKVLTLLLRLRQICCDTALFSPETYDTWSMEQRSAKTERLLQIVDGTLASGQKMLVFSQFAKQLHLIESELNTRSISSLRLDGATQNRQELVDRFQDSSGPAIFLISLKAGGYGLNLTAASTVVHFDPWWNPAAERQASDRAHRIGQTRRVSVYQLLTRGTVEDRVKKLQREKAELADGLFGADPLKSRKMPSMQEIHQLLQI